MRPRFSARLLFAALGCGSCLLGALMLDALFGAARISRFFTERDTPVLLYYFPHHSETERRLQAANAKSGDIEIALTWNNLNDLDLHCMDPLGEEISYSNSKSPRTGGELDIDRNAHAPYTTSPVEHIYWPRGHAPAGTYRVYVNHYARHGGMDPTAYQVIVTAFGRTTRYNGTISHTSVQPTNSLGKLICEFRAGPPQFSLAWFQSAFFRALVLMAVWTGVLAAILAVTLLAGLSLFYRLVYKRRFLSLDRCIALSIGLAGWGILVGVCGQLLYSLTAPYFLAAAPIVHATFWHTGPLVLLAALLGLSFGGRIPHLGRLPAFLAATLAGLASGRIFLLLVWAGSQMWGRAAAAALIGGAIGLMIALIVEAPEPPIEIEEETYVEGARPLALRASRIGPAGKLRRAGREALPGNRSGTRIR